MKEFVCSSCKESWNVKDEQANKVLCCPFCAFEIPKPKEIIVTSFETAIQKVINDLTVEVLKNRNQFIAYLMDIGPQFQKEIHIFSKICDNSIFNRLYKLSQLPSDEICLESAKLKEFLINEEGVSDTWSKKIIDSFVIDNENFHTTDDSVISITNVEIKQSTDKKEQKDASCHANDNNDKLTIQEYVDRMIENTRPIKTPFGEFTYSDARLYLEMQILKNTLIIPKGYYTIAPNAIDGLSVEKLFIPGSINNIPDKLFRSAWKLKNIYVASSNSYYKTKNNGKELYDAKKNKLIYKIND